MDCRALGDAHRAPVELELILGDSEPASRRSWPEPRGLLEARLEEGQLAVPALGGDLLASSGEVLRVLREEHAGPVGRVRGRVAASDGEEYHFLVHVVARDGGV
mmetsp:Transcript_15712/g.53311  ORF Transcript_15712/g.53311 Transcript_15712/m.53311 type:complete len:104 (+) Transcript_15712:955-1266(+)